jgi:Flp pilus assembly pilin Flp
MLMRLWNDESGFIISAELVLVATLLVLGMIVGLSEVQHAVVSELNDVADAIGSLNQSYCYSGFSKPELFGGGVKAYTRGSIFFDSFDECDNNQCAIDCDAPVREGPKFNGGFNCAGF